MNFLCLMFDVPKELFINISSDKKVKLLIRTSTRARRIRLTVRPWYSEPILVIPLGTSFERAQTFVDNNLEWLDRIIINQISLIPLIGGSILPVLGKNHVIRSQPSNKQGVWVEQKNGDRFPQIMVGGKVDQVAKKIECWLKSLARTEIENRTNRYAKKIGRQITRITIRDPKTRWGSCSSIGCLSFSWRIILAPEMVLNYVCAHEVAHLLEMNHSPKFWAHVESLLGDVAPPRKWLKLYGEQLHRYRV